MGCGMRPLGPRVIVERLEAEDKSPGGIIMPDVAKKKPAKGRVLAVGPGGYNDKGDRQPIDCDVGDMIYFGQWAGQEVEVGGKTLLAVMESEIISVVDE